MRVVIADDEALFRDGLARLLADAGVDAVATVGTADELLRKVELTRPERTTSSRTGRCACSRSTRNASATC